MTTFQPNAVLLDRIKAAAKHPDAIHQVAMACDEPERVVIDEPCETVDPEVYICDWNDRYAAANAIVGNPVVADRPDLPIRHPSEPGWFASDIRIVGFGPMEDRDGFPVYRRARLRVGYSKVSAAKGE